MSKSLTALEIADAMRYCFEVTNTHDGFSDEEKETANAGIWALGGRLLILAGVTTQEELMKLVLKDGELEHEVKKPVE